MKASNDIKKGILYTYKGSNTVNDWVATVVVQLVGKNSPTIYS